MKRFSYKAPGGRGEIVLMVVPKKEVIWNLYPLFIGESLWGERGSSEVM